MYLVSSLFHIWSLQRTFNNTPPMKRFRAFKFCHWCTGVLLIECERPNLLHSETGLHLKRKSEKKIGLKTRLSAKSELQPSTRKDPMACPRPELLPSYSLTTVSQKSIWLFQVCLQTTCDCVWSCFRAPTCQLTIIIQLNACQEGPSSLASVFYKTFSWWEFGAASANLVGPW